MTLSSRWLKFALLACLALSGAPALADDAKPTPELAKQLTQEAAALIAAAGVDSARAAFHAPGKWRFGEIYVTVIDMAGAWVVYPPRPAGEGQSVLNVKDADGKFLVKELMAVATNQGEGWVKYRWLNPETNKIAPKTSFVKKIPGQELFTFVGIYD